ncbi:MAG: histidine kinase N-terminal 7TM domain-containing protein [Anaerolineae bacterium]
MPVAIITLAAILLVIHVWQRHRTAPGAKVFIAMGIMGIEWLISYSLWMMSFDLSQKLFWTQASYIAVVSLPVLWLIIAYRYTEQRLHLTKLHLVLLCAIPLTTLILSWTNSSHELIWREILYYQQDTVLLSRTSYGPWFWVHTAYSYLLLLIGSMLLVIKAMRSRHPWRTLTLLGAIIAPWVASILDILKLEAVPRIEMTAAAFTLSGIAMTWALFHFRLFDPIPLAREQLIEALCDGVIVLDHQNRLVDLNPQAEALIGQILSMSNRQRAEEILAPYPELLQLALTPGEKHTEIKLVKDSDDRFYDVQAIPLHDEDKTFVGQLLILHDITQRKRADRALQVERAKSREILNRRDAILEAVSFAAANLLGEAAWEQSVTEALEHLGNATRVSRVYIFEGGGTEDRHATVSQRFEWVAPGIEPQLTNPHLQNLPYREIGFERWWKVLRENRALYGHVREFPRVEREILEPQSIKSLLIVPIFVAGNLWGFIGFDECTAERNWLPVEIETLKLAADTIGSAIRRRQIEEELRESERYLALLNEITRAALDTPDLTAMLETLAERMGTLFDADNCYVTLWDEVRGAAIPTAAFGEWSSQYRDLAPVSDEPTITESVLAVGHPLVIPNLHSSPLINPRFLRGISDRTLLALPLVAARRRLGAVLITFNNERTFTPQEIKRGQQAAHQVALAVAKAQHLKETQARWREAETLRQTAVALATTLDREEVITRILEQLKEVVPYDSASVQLLHGTELELVGGSGYEESSALSGMTIPLIPAHPNTEVIESCTPLIVADAPANYEGFEQIPHGREVHAWLGVPMRIGDHLLGIIALNKEERGFYTQEHARLCEAFAAEAAIALENSRLFNAERTQREFAEALSAAAAAVSSTLDLDQVLDRILQQIERVVDGVAFNVMLIKDDKVRVTRWRGYEDLSVEESVRSIHFDLDAVPLFQQMAETGKPAVINDTRTAENWVSVAPQPWLRSYLGAPIQVKGVTVGFLNVDGGEPGQFGAADARRLQGFADHVATALENAQLFRELRDYTNELEARVQRRTSELQAQYARQSAILESTSEGLIVTNSEGQIVQMNPVARTWLTQTLSPQEADALRAAVQKLTQNRTSDPEAMIELTGLHLQLKAAPIVKSAGEEGTVVALHDISHLKSLDRMKTQFVSNVSHELRTPATTIKLYASLLRRHIGDREKLLTYLDALQQEAEHQARLIEEILQISRIDAGRMKVDPTPVLLDELVANIVADRQLRAQQKGLTLEHQSSELEMLAMIDLQRIAQVIDNLLENAFRYTPQGGHIIVATDRVEKWGRNWAVLHVIDTGLGIPDHEIPHLFDRFFRGERPQEQNISGTGLGLAIVKEIVELHGGRVTVKSAVGEGSTFTVWLPLAA